MVKPDYAKLQYWEMRDIVAKIYREVKHRNPIFVNAYLEGLAKACSDLDEISKGERENFTSESGPREHPDMTMIRYPFRTLKEARLRAQRGTAWLSNRGCNQILTVLRSAKEVEVPVEIATIWPGICDLMTE